MKSRQAFEASDEQKAIITAPPDARILVEAEAGTGKTEVVARRLAYLLGSTDLKPSNILVLSFSRAAVRVLTERLRKVAKDETTVEDLRWTTVRTFDSWAFRLLRQLGREPRTLLAAGYNANIAELLEELQDRERLLKHPEVNLGRLRHVVVDEMQDLTSVRARLVRRLLELLAPPRKPGAGFTLLGDSCQAIYDWTLNDDPDPFGSRELLEWVVQAYSAQLQRLSLTGNRRAGAGITATLEQARHCLQKVSKTTRSRDPLDAIRVVRNSLKAQDLGATMKDIGRCAGQSFAILCRDNGQVLRVAEALAKEWQGARTRIVVLAGSPPRILPSWIGRLLSRFEGSQISRRGFDTLFSRLDSSAPHPSTASSAWAMLLRFAHVPEDRTALSMDMLRQRLEWPDSLPDDEGERVDQVVLSTIHQSKGKEFDRVRIVTGSEEQSGDRVEEARVIYVALTRARSEIARTSFDAEPLFPEECSEGRKRSHRWTKTRKGGAHHDLELGCDGDLDPASVVQESVLGGGDNVRAVQQLLAAREEALVGLEVTATKKVLSENPPRVAYRLYAKVPQDAEVCLGQFSDAVRKDIHKVTYRDQGLPKNVYGLRIGSVTTYVARGVLPTDVPEPWRNSGIWLGITVHGLAGFMTYWRNQ